MTGKVFVLYNSYFATGEGMCNSILVTWCATKLKAQAEFAKKFGYYGTYVDEIFELPEQWEQFEKSMVPKYLGEVSMNLLRAQVYPDEKYGRAGAFSIHMQLYTNFG